MAEKIKLQIYGKKQTGSSTRYLACTISLDIPKVLTELLERRKRDIARQTVQENFPKIQFHFTSEV